MKILFIVIFVYFIIGSVTGILAVRHEYMQSNYKNYETFCAWNEPDATIFAYFFAWPIIVSADLIIIFFEGLMKFVCPDKKKEEDNKND